MKSAAVRVHWQALVAFSLAALLAAGGARAGDLQPPEAIGELKLGHALRGRKALEAINRLHGKGVGAANGYVAHYERDGMVAMLYVSRPDSRTTTREQIDRMVSGIRGGRTPFSHLKSSDQGGTTVYSALGEGQIHYFFRRDQDVIWIAADPGVARQALESVLRPKS